LQGGGGAEEDPATAPRWFVVVYDQTTSYRTTDAPVSLGTVVRRPFDPDVASDLVDRLRSGFPDALSTLTEIRFVEEEDGAPPPSFIAAASAPPSPAPSFVVATAAPPTTPTDAPTAAAAADAMEPTPFPSPRPPIPSRAPTSRPAAALLTITGLVWLDEDGNGLFETTEEPLAGVYVTLRECVVQTYKGLVQTDAIGQYVFTNLDEGLYYVDFLKPGAGYEFTIPKIGGEDEDAVDSDVISQDSYKGSSDCLTVTEGFKLLTNAGFVPKEEEEESKLAPTNSPSKAPASDPPTKPPTKQPAPEFCTIVSGQNFDFAGCDFPCVDHDDCPKDMLCVFTNDCSA
jgi:hypothetical protein